MPKTKTIKSVDELAVNNVSNNTQLESNASKQKPTKSKAPKTKIVKTKAEGEKANDPPIKGIKSSMRRLFRSADLGEMRIGDKTLHSIPDYLAEEFTNTLRQIVTQTTAAKRITISEEDVSTITGDPIPNREAGDKLKSVIAKAPFQRYVRELLKTKTPLSDARVSKEAFDLLQVNYEKIACRLIKSAAVYSDSTGMKTITNAGLKAVIEIRST